MLEYTETIDELRVARNLREIFRDGENVSEKVQNDIINPTELAQEKSRSYNDLMIE